MLPEHHTGRRQCAPAHQYRNAFGSCQPHFPNWADGCAYYGSQNPAGESAPFAACASLWQHCRRKRKRHWPAQAQAALPISPGCQMCKHIPNIPARKNAISRPGFPAFRASVRGCRSNPKHSTSRFPGALPQNQFSAACRSFPVYWTVSVVW